MTAQTTLFDWRAERDAAMAQVATSAGPTFRELAEAWLPIPGYPDHFVSSIGRVRSVDRQVARIDGRTHLVKGVVRRLSVGTMGYPQITLCDPEGKERRWNVHRLVMLAFHPRPDCGDLEVNHKDGVRANNLLENLEWCTSSENHLHAYRVLNRKGSGLGWYRELNPNSRAVIARCLSTGETKEYASINSAEDDGFKRCGITLCARGKIASYRNWTWQYKDPARWLNPQN